LIFDFRKVNLGENMRDLEEICGIWIEIFLEFLGKNFILMDNEEE
jgi:hypothetical protein